MTRIEMAQVIRDADPAAAGFVVSMDVAHDMMRWSPSPLETRPAMLTEFVPGTGRPTSFKILASKYLAFGTCLAFRNDQESALREVLGCDLELASAARLTAEQAAGRCALEFIECECGFHFGLDATFMEKVGDFKVGCPSCGKTIDTAAVCSE